MKRTLKFNIHNLFHINPGLHNWYGANWRNDIKKDLLPAGSYKEVEFKVELNPTATEPALSLNGTYTSTGPAIPIIFRIATPLEIETEMNNVTVLANNGYNALTTLNLSLLTRGMSQTMLDNAVKTNGTILINSSSNVDLFNIILNNLKECDDIDFEDD